ncbi:MAG: kinase [Caulobacter sp.]|nr:kinase [Caulobacter sp.]
MIVTRTPFRVSLFGGGSDYPAWYEKHGGSVLGFAIDKYCYISVRELPPFFEHRHRIVYSAIESVREIDEIRHPAVRAVLSEMAILKGLEVHHDGDLPARSGLGSSSSFTVGLLNALNALQGRMIGQRELALEAIRIEQKVIGENVGSQDQVWAAYGGFNRIDFRHDGSFDLQPIIVPVDRRRDLEQHCMLFFSGLSRYASQMAAKKIANLADRGRHIRSMVSMIDEATEILGSPGRDITELGELLHESWMLKRELADGVSTPEIDTIYAEARAAGALGGKLLGAGGGGFVLLFVRPEHQRAVRERLSRLIAVDVRIERQGSRVVVYEPNGLEHA